MGKTANNDAFIESTNWLTEGLEDETESTPVLLLDMRAVSIKNTPSIIVSIFTPKMYAQELIGRNQISI